MEEVFYIPVIKYLVEFEITYRDDQPLFEKVILKAVREREFIPEFNNIKLIDLWERYLMVADSEFFLFKTLSSLKEEGVIVYPEDKSIKNLKLNDIEIVDGNIPSQIELFSKSEKINKKYYFFWEPFWGRLFLLDDEEEERDLENFTKEELREKGIKVKGLKRFFHEAQAMFMKKLKESGKLLFGSGEFKIKNVEKIACFWKEGVIFSYEVDEYEDDDELFFEMDLQEDEMYREENDDEMFIEQEYYIRKGFFPLFGIGKLLKKGDDEDIELNSSFKFLYLFDLDKFNFYKDER